MIFLRKNEKEIFEIFTTETMVATSPAFRPGLPDFS
jgi:hypothetical protein